MPLNCSGICDKARSLHIDPEVYQITKDKKGMLNVLFVPDGVRQFIHSSYDAVKDGRSFADKNYVTGRDIAVFGLGLGYHVKPLITKLEPGQRLYVFETNLSLFRIAIENTDIQDYFHHENVFFCVGNSFSDVVKYYFLCLERKAFFVWYHPAINTVPETVRLQTEYTRLYEMKLNYSAPVESLDYVKKLIDYKPIKRAKKYRVVIVGFSNENASVKSFIENWILAFRYLGCEVSFMSTDSFIKYERKLRKAQMIDYQLSDVDFFVVCNNPFFDSQLFRQANKPIISVQIDRPFTTSVGMSIEDLNLKQAIYTWSDRVDLNHAGLYYKQGVHHFLAHGGEINFDPSGIFSSARPIDVVLSCNHVTEGIPSEFVYKDTRIDNATIERIMALYRESGRFLDDCVLEILGRDIDNEAFREFMHNAGYIIENLTRLEKRYKVVKALLDSGISLHLFGMGWDTTDVVDYPNCVYHGYISYDPGRKIFEHCKILVDNLPSSSGSGAHERIFSSMLRGVLCVSIDTGYLRETFSEDNEIVLYENNNLATMVEKVKYYLTNEDERLRITKNAFENVRANHTWINRAEKMLDFYEDFVSGR